MADEKKTGPRNWDDIIKASNGTLMYLPEELKPLAEEWYKKRQEFYLKANELAKAENILGNLFNNLVLKTKEELESRNVEGIWAKDFGLNLEALREGKYIVQITENKALQ